MFCGQHHNNWQNLINFCKQKNLTRSWWIVFTSKSKIILKLKNYAEYNSPFMGLFLNFLIRILK